MRSVGLQVSAPPVGEGIRRPWIAALVIGELVGFVPPALVGAGLLIADAGIVWVVIGLTAAGALEGAALGAAQARVLSRLWPGLGRRAWTLATAAAAAFAWFIGMGGSALAGSSTLPFVASAIPLAFGSLLALFSMGYLQWLVLRRTVSNSGRWVPVTAAAWLVGVPIPIVALSVIPDGWPIVGRVLIAVMAAAAMGMTVGVITGNTLQQLAEDPNGPSAMNRAKPVERGLR